MKPHDLMKAASCGEPSYVWRAGQERRLSMIQRAAGKRVLGCVLENGCGVGLYVRRLARDSRQVVGLEYDFSRLREVEDLLDRADGSAGRAMLVCAAGERVPFPFSSFDLVLSHEVLEHVQDDRLAIEEVTRVLKTGGRLVLFVPNRGYPFETHGIYWRGIYRFGNIPLVNYLPRRWRNKLAPHVRVYSSRDLESLFLGLPMKLIERRIIFGAYDNLIARFGVLGKILRAVLQFLERTPLQFLGLSHFWVMEKQ